jgi:hypothetical protein
VVLLQEIKMDPSNPQIPLDRSSLDGGLFRKLESATPRRLEIVIDGKSYEVEEYILLWDLYKNPNGYKLIWARRPILKTVIDDFASPCVHKDFTRRPEFEGQPQNALAEDLARNKVKEAFIEYWKNPKTIQEMAAHDSQHE